MRLQSQQTYIDRFDRLTVERCRQHEGNFHDAIAAMSKDDPAYKLKKGVIELALKMSMPFFTGEEAIKKEETIRKWMEEDKRRDDLEEHAVAPQGIHCLRCRELMAPTFKTLNEDDRVLFFFDCPNKCLPRRCFYDNGEEWLPKPEKCIKCGLDARSESKRDGRDIITTVSCSTCQHIETSRWQMHEKREPVIDPHYEADRARFCLSREKLSEYITEKRNLEEVSKMLEKYKDEEKMGKVDDLLKQIRTLSLAGVQSLLSKTLETRGFAKFDTAVPTSGYKTITIDFTAQDTIADRDPWHAKKEFKLQIISSLRDTNWRLLDATVECSLGLIKGRLKGYQNIADMRELVEKETENG